MLGGCFFHFETVIAKSQVQHHTVVLLRSKKAISKTLYIKSFQQIYFMTSNFHYCIWLLDPMQLLSSRTCRHPQKIKSGAAKSPLCCKCS